MKKLFVLIIVASGALLVGFFAGPQFAQFFTSEPDNPVQALEPEKDCFSARNDCLAFNSALKLKLKLAQPVYYLKPFPIEVMLSGPQSESIKSVRIAFHMPGMNMGTNKVNLIKEEVIGNGTGRWRGRAFLPVCVAGRNDWFAVVEANGQSIDYQSTFPMVVKRAP